MDDVTLAAALLHDSVEDTAVSLPELEASFGPAVAQIVDGVTKLERVSFDSRQAAQAATMRKMLVAMAKDPRVLLIKLGDRLHNMRTVAAMPEANQKRSTFMPRSRTASASPASNGSWRISRSLRCTRAGTHRSNKWWPPGRPSAIFTWLRSKSRSKSA
jgi:(p)ppGpp synthase/HD superfamily hydrolase